MASQGLPLGIGEDWNYQYIDGEKRQADGETIAVENPATREPIAQVPAGTAVDVDDAFEAAAAAQEDWAAQPPQVRIEVLQKAIHLVHEHQSEIAELLVQETGSTLLKAGVEVEQLAPGMMGEAASYPTRAQGSHADSVIPGKENEIIREPIGTVGIITPWNVPFHLTMRALAPAIALGNAVVLKPAEDTPITGGLLHSVLFEAAGLPDGVLNVVNGYGPEAGDRLASHPDLDLLSFTGSTEVGRQVAGKAARNLASPALELGGNGPHVVLEDADFEYAVDAGVFGSFLHQGQICISINRHIVHESMYDEYVTQLTKRAEGLTVGNPADPETDIGPVINESQRDSMLEFVEASVEAGATVETGNDYDDLFVEPTVLSDVTNDMAVARNEHFGPIVPVIPFSDDDEAVDIANDTEMGLAASVHGSDLGRAKEIAKRIQSGMVHVNDQPINDEPHVPFGGVKGSGIGRYNAENIMNKMTRERWISVQHDQREFPI